MLLLDLSAIITQSCINLHRDLGNEAVELNVVRHYAFSSILHYKKKFSKKYGKPIICVDRKPYWRTKVFPEYKQNRKKARKESDIDWATFSQNFKEIQLDVRDYLPYKFLEVPLCEADDIIAVLTQIGYRKKEEVMIVSSDKDLIQLQTRYDRVKQYSPKQKKQLDCKSVEYDLLDHILRGDSSDGIPNIFSPDDTFVAEERKRQKPITAKVTREVLEHDNPIDYCSTKEMRRQFKRNELLIDLSKIPDRIVKSIEVAYDVENRTQRRNSVMKYARKYKLRNLLDKVQDF